MATSWMAVFWITVPWMAVFWMSGWLLLVDGQFADFGKVKIVGHFANLSKSKINLTAKPP